MGQMQLFCTAQDATVLFVSKPSTRKNSTTAYQPRTGSLSQSNMTHSATSEECADTTCILSMAWYWQTGITYFGKTSQLQPVPLERERGRLARMTVGETSPLSCPPQNVL